MDFVTSDIISLTALAISASVAYVQFFYKAEKLTFSFIDVSMVGKPHSIVVIIEFALFNNGDYPATIRSMRMLKAGKSFKDMDESRLVEAGEIKNEIYGSFEWVDIRTNKAKSFTVNPGELVHDKASFILDKDDLPENEFWQIAMEINFLDKKWKWCTEVCGEASIGITQGPSYCTYVKNRTVVLLPKRRTSFINWDGNRYST